MTKFSKIIVITTINKKTSGIAEFEKFDDWHLVIVGDKKSAPIPNSESLTFLSWEEQLELGYEYARICPWNHYARKNVGYLYASNMGAKLIFDTDDDNIPYNQRWRVPEFTCKRRVFGKSKFVNIYSYFTDEHIWPRGLPLDEIHSGKLECEEIDQPLKIGIWQGLADDDPDVDAIYRLIFNKNIKFLEKEPISLPSGTYSPFNSQNTFWLDSVFPMMYLPATVSFRSTDIYRGYIAQRLMWQLKYYLGYLGATVYQERNVHDLMADFREEWECYNNIKGFINILDETELAGDLTSGMRAIYKNLYNNKFVLKAELEMVDAWLADMHTIIDHKSDLADGTVSSGK